MTTAYRPRFLLGAALAGAAALPLLAGQAQALPSVLCYFGGAAGTPVCPTNPLDPKPKVTVDDKTVTFLQQNPASLVGSGVIDFEQVQFPPPGPLNDQYTVDIDFASALSAPTTPVSTFFDYSIAIDPTNEFIYKEVALDFNNFNTAATVTKQIFKTSNFDINDPNSYVGQLTGKGSFVLPGVKNLWIRDIINVPVGSAIDNVTNTYYQVPGPLPLLGAGTAFGFSRRLRRRCKQSYSLG